MFDAAAAAELLLSREWPDRRDAEGLVKRFGVERVRDAVRHADFLQTKGEVRKTYRGVVVGFLRGGWAVDDRLKAEQSRVEALKRADQARRRAAAAAEARRAELAERERRDELLWSQLPAETRAELHRAVLARLPESSRRFFEGRPVESMRPQILAEARQRREAG